MYDTRHPGAPRTDDEGSSPMAGQLIIGLFIIGLGIIFTLDNLQIVDGRQFLRYWPVALMALGLVKIASGDGGWKGGAVLTFVGGVLLLNNLGIIRARLWDFWPLILIGGGALLAWRGWQGVPDAPVSTNGSSVLTGVAVLSGFDRTIDSQTFHGGELTAIMGGGKIDLRGARMGDGVAVLTIYALMGGVELRIPDSWMVENKVVYFMGGAEDRTRRSAGGSPAPRLILRGFVMMGGVEIRN